MRSTILVLLCHLQNILLRRCLPCQQLPVRRPCQQLLARRSCQQNCLTKLNDLKLRKFLNINEPTSFETNHVKPLPKGLHCLFYISPWQKGSVGKHKLNQKNSISKILNLDAPFFLGDHSDLTPRKMSLVSKPIFHVRDRNQQQVLANLIPNPKHIWGPQCFRLHTAVPRQSPYDGKKHARI